MNAAPVAATPHDLKNSEPVMASGPATVSCSWPLV